MPRRLTKEYREEVGRFLLRFIDNCDKCNDTSELSIGAKYLLLRLNEYNKLHEKKRTRITMPVREVVPPEV